MEKGKWAEVIEGTRKKAEIRGAARPKRRLRIEGEKGAEEKSSSRIVGFLYGHHEGMAVRRSTSGFD